MKGIRLLRTERTSRTRNAPVGERLTTGTYSGGLFVEGRPEERKASIADWRKCPASTLQERARHEPHFHGMTVKGLSLADLISREKYWYELPETIDPAAERRIRWVGRVSSEVDGA
jgi:hypothetical protein